ncbi:MAG: PAS domain S-box protein, partial [Desulfocurvibacter africanus]
MDETTQDHIHLREALIALADAHFTCSLDANGNLGPIEDGLSLCRLLDRDGSCDRGLRLQQIIHHKDARRLEAMLDRLGKGLAVDSIRLVSRFDQSIEVTLTLLRENGRVFGAMRRRKVEVPRMRMALEAQDAVETSPVCKLLDQRLQFAQCAFDHASLMIFWLDESGRILYANETATRTLGYTAEELRSLSYCDIDPVCQELGRPNIWKSLGRQKSLEFETRFRSKTGLVFPVEISSNLVDFEGREQHVIYARDISARKRTEDIQRQSKEFFRVIFHGVYDAIIIHNRDGGIADVNEKMLDLYGLTREEALAASITEHLSAPDNQVETLVELWKQVLEGHPRFFEWKAIRPRTGEVFDVEVYLRRIPFGDDDVIMANIRDISERRKAEHEQLLAAKVYQNSVEGITVTDSDGHIISVNPAFSKITGYTAEEAMGQNPRILKSHLHDEAFYKAIWQSLNNVGQWEGEIWNRRKNGEVYPEWLSISSVIDESGRLQNYVAVFHDITEIKASQEKVRHQAHHDVLTGLPNRLLLKDRISTALAHMARAGQKMALLFLDIDNFKHVNDSLGHPVGDQLLQAVAARIKGAVRDEDTVARLGGDEFVIMVEALDNEVLAIAAASRLLEAFRAPFHIKGNELIITPSLGIALYPDDGDDAETLIKNADMAMYRAKEKGRNTFQLYTPALNERAVRRMTMEGELRKALERGDIQPWFQPRVGLRNGSVVGSEALARWIKPDGTIISPGEFIPLAEETGLILPLGEQILEQACRRIRAFQVAGFPEQYVSVNLSPRQFRQKDLVGMVERVLERTGFDSRLLELEITESSLVQDIDQTMATLRRL